VEEKLTPPPWLDVVQLTKTHPCTSPFPTEFARKQNGYDTLKGVRRSFIPFAFSFYAYEAHWWTNTAETLEEAVEEMPAGYADKMEPVINNIPVLIVMLILTILVAVIGMRSAEIVLKKQAEALN